MTYSMAFSNYFTNYLGIHEWALIKTVIMTIITLVLKFLGLRSRPL